MYFDWSEGIVTSHNQQKANCSQEHVQKEAETDEV